MFWWFYKTWIRKTTNLFIKTWFGISNAVKHVSIHINTNTKVQLIIFSRSVLLLYDHVFVSPKHGFIIQVCVWDTEMTKLFFKTWFWDLWYMIPFTTHQLFYTTTYRLREFWAPAFERDKTERPNFERPTFERQLLSDHLGARLLSAHYLSNNRSKVGAYVSRCACVLRLIHMNICIHEHIFTKMQSRRNLILSYPSNVTHAN